MPDQTPQTVREVLGRRASGTARLRRRIDDSNVLGALDVADGISMVALFFAWAGAVALVSGAVNGAVIATAVAAGFDKLDGYYARRFGAATDLGRRIDAFVDVFAYLVPAALLYHVALSPHLAASVVVGFAVLAFGGLRLVRFTVEGFGEESDTSYYRGTTVVHTYLLVVAVYLLDAYAGLPGGWIAGGVIVAACPPMLSNYRSYKTAGTQALAALGALAVVGLVLLLEFGAP